MIKNTSTKLLVATDKHKVYKRGTPLAVLRGDQDQNLAGGTVMIIELPSVSYREAMDICGFTHPTDPQAKGFVDLDAMGVSEGKVSRSWEEVKQHITKPR